MNTPEYYTAKRKTLTTKINKLLVERDKLSVAKRPVAEKLRELEGKLMYDKSNKPLMDERDGLRAEQFVMGGEVRRYRVELQKLKKEWLAMDVDQSIDRQRDEGRSRPAQLETTRTEDY